MSRSPVRFRAFRISDYDRIHAIWRATAGIGLNESDTREAIGQFLRRNPGFSQVALVERRIVGAVLCGHDGRRGYLHHLAVVPPWRRQGIARRLVADCVAKLRQAGIPKCNLFLFANNASGRRFWKRLGWEVRTNLRLVQRGTQGSA